MDICVQSTGAQYGFFCIVRYMISFSRHTLANGLKVIIHTDVDSPNVVLNILYNVGSRVEDPSKTGFAHLFEHLMFGGSANIESYDTPLQNVGGQNNAFTSQDITNYYLTLPASNAETGFWLESDRMKALNFDPKVLEVQQKVVIEEFKQRYLNQPYGDFWLKIFPLAYKEHSYNWPTIGKSIEHIEAFTLDDVRSFFYNYYGPNNAILVIAGNIEEAQALALAEKWFGDIEPITLKGVDLKPEPVQEAYREEIIEAAVPVDAVYVAYHSCSRLSKDYYACDLLSDILGRGKGSYLYEALVRNASVFTNVSAYMLGNLDPGLLILEGKVSQGQTAETAVAALLEAVERFADAGPTEEMVTKARNQAASSFEFNNVELLNRAMNLAYFELLGDAELINEETAKILAITGENIASVAKNVLLRTNASAILYKKNGDEVPEYETEEDEA
jgi:zinc protease